MSLQDPPRLSEPASGTSDAVRALLKAGRRELPRPEELARLAARLPLGPLPPAGAVPSVVPGALVGALLGLAVAGGLWWRDIAEAWRDAPPAATAVVVTATTAPAGTTVEMLRADILDPPREPPPAPPRAEPKVAMAAATQSTAEPAPAVSSEQETEVQLLQRAQGALGGNPGRALALAEEHLKRYPGGKLAQEREMIAVAALVGLGRSAEAHARATAFLQAFPSSAHRRRVESLAGVSLNQNGEPLGPHTP